MLEGYGFVGKLLFEPVHINVTCDPAVYKCEKLPPAPSPSKRKLLPAAVESENQKAMAEEYADFSAGKQDQTKVTWASMNLSDGTCTAGNATRAQFDICQHNLRVFINDALRDQLSQSTQIMDAQISKGLAARTYLRGLRYTIFAPEGIPNPSDQIRVKA